MLELFFGAGVVDHWPTRSIYAGGTTFDSLRTHVLVLHGSSMLGTSKHWMQLEIGTKLYQTLVLRNDGKLPHHVISGPMSSLSARAFGPKSQASFKQKTC